jgi:cysteine-rich repeat protein
VNLRNEECDLGSVCTGRANSCNRPLGFIAIECACVPGSPNCDSPVPGVSFEFGCLFARCGDGFINNIATLNGVAVNYQLVHEECDDGNVRSDDGCSNRCKIEEGDFPPSEDPFCGDAFVNQSSEQCDDGNNDNGDGCSSNCRIESTRFIPPTFTPVRLCGDGAVNQTTEQCDDGNVISNDGCSAACQNEAVVPMTATNRCGDGLIHPLEECDDRNLRDGDGCSAQCLFEIAAPGQPPIQFFCGDGIIAQGEQCDDGNVISSDGCSASCRAEETLVAAASVCGDGVLEGAEECDDSNNTDGDGCNARCLQEIGICGDGIVQKLLGEQCEEASHSSLFAFDCFNCRFLSRFCGDEELNPGEECDTGARNSTARDAACRPDCSIARCSDGILDSSEECDDGNRLDSDGCDRYCRIERDIPEQGPTQVAGQQFQQMTQQQQVMAQFQARYGRNIQFPGMPNAQALPYQLPLAQLQPLIQSQGPIGDTGPAAVAVIGAGAAAGWSWMRRRRK